MTCWVWVSVSVADEASTAGFMEHYNIFQLIGYLLTYLAASGCCCHFITKVLTLLLNPSQSYDDIRPTHAAY